MKRTEGKVWLVLGLAMALNLSLKEDAMAFGGPLQNKNKNLKQQPARKTVPAPGSSKSLKTPGSDKPKLPVLIGPASLLLTPWLSHCRILFEADTTA